ncbi:MAG: type ISP restriction/modification enzyme, partial [Dolichospermum sp.]
SKFSEIRFEHITPDKNFNWINQSDNDFESLLPLVDKDVKAGKAEEAVFKLFCRGVETNRDEWVYDFNRTSLKNKILFLSVKYNYSVDNQEKDLSIYNQIVRLDPTFIENTENLGQYTKWLFRKDNLTWILNNIKTRRGEDLY